ncbi:DUF6252 family protein [Bizionia paragorgiae]|uniref:Uncharacterized protein n=1 Tax=Bizionia paragorgiae TaxID=283786 RepID=A0A1H4D8M3_BIZPA|nr:DUF6252 family protein [Bizionia paragorgiae]SEA68759.1 hypothetical protein SAMN04487990_1266 [Bizionia paragorgiae]
MKNIVVLVLTMVALLSCSNETKFKTPSFEAKKDGNLFEAVSYQASIVDNGQIVITGTDNYDTVNLVVNSVSPGLYDVQDANAFATHVDINGVIWSTENTPDPDVQIYPANGMIDLKVVNLEEGFVSGEFYFNAFNSSGMSSVNFNEGIFVKVPLTGGVVSDSDPTNTDCQTATAAAQVSGQTLAVSDPTDPGYEALCNDYMQALMTQMNACGDANGSIQAEIDSLDCTPAATVVSGAITVTVGTDARTFDENITADLNGTVVSVRAEDANSGDWVSFEVVQGQTGANIISNFVIHLISTDYTPANNASGIFTSNISVNTTTEIDGTFSGPVESATGGDVSLTSGVIDINY